MIDIAAKGSEEAHKNGKSDKAQRIDVKGCADSEKLATRSVSCVLKGVPSKRNVLSRLVSFVTVDKVLLKSI